MWRSPPLMASLWDLNKGSDILAKDTGVGYGFWGGHLLRTIRRTCYCTLAFWACEWHWGGNPLCHSLRWLASQHTGAGLAVAALPAPPLFTYHLYEDRHLVLSHEYAFSRGEVRPSYRHASSIPCSSSFSVSTIYRLTRLNHMGREASRRWATLQGRFAPKQGLEPVSVLK